MANNETCASVAVPSSSSKLDPLGSLQRCIGSNDMLRRLICGAVAGVCAKSAVAPAERVKISFQLSSEKFTYKKSYARCLEMIREGGVRSLWRGHSANVVRVAPYAALHYTIHDYAEDLLTHSSIGSRLNPMAVQVISGAMAGGGATFLTYPLDVVRVRIAFAANKQSAVAAAHAITNSAGGNDAIAAAAVKPVKTPTIVEAWTAAVRHGGLYQGFVPTMLGIVPYSAVAWCAKSSLQQQYPTFSQHPLTAGERLVINAVAGLLGQFATYPLDIVRRRMQMVKAGAATDCGEGKIETMRQVLLRLYRTEGWRGLSKGYSLNVIKGPITLSISLTVYDLMQQWARGDGARPKKVT